MLDNPSAGHDPALPAEVGLTDFAARSLADLDTMEGRISAWCAWFGLEQPKLRHSRKGGVILNDALLNWLFASGGSFDRFVVGDVRAMAVGYRKQELQERRFAEVLKHYDETEQALLLDAMMACNDDGLSMEEAMEGWKAAVLAHRESVKA